jgi:carbonic anhydrase
MKGMVFCTVINCMDGRLQMPVIQHLQRRFGVPYVDSITEAGPNRILAEQQEGPEAQSLLEKLRISFEEHGSRAVAVVGHHDCVGNPGPYEKQVAHVRESIRFLRSCFGDKEVIGLWVDGTWEVHDLADESG